MGRAGEELKALVVVFRRDCRRLGFDVEELSVVRLPRSRERDPNGPETAEVIDFAEQLAARKTTACS